MKFIIAKEQDPYGLLVGPEWRNQNQEQWEFTMGPRLAPGNILLTDYFQTDLKAIFLSGWKLPVLYFNHPITISDHDVLWLSHDFLYD